MHVIGNRVPFGTQVSIHHASQMIMVTTSPRMMCAEVMGQKSSCYDSGRSDSGVDKKLTCRGIVSVSLYFVIDTMSGFELFSSHVTSMLTCLKFIS